MKQLEPTCDQIEDEIRRVHLRTGHSLTREEARDNLLGRTFVEFTFEQRAYIVARCTQLGHPVYREKAHLGGRWGDAILVAKNKDLKLGFRRKLEAAISTLNTINP